MASWKPDWDFDQLPHSADIAIYSADMVLQIIFVQRGDVLKVRGINITTPSELYSGMDSPLSSLL